MYYAFGETRLTRRVRRIERDRPRRLPSPIASAAESQSDPRRVPLQGELGETGDEPE